ncbi:hypothetical protein L9F63_002131, partial [Diploptera punctata]
VCPCLERSVCDESVSTIYFKIIPAIAKFAPKLISNHFANNPRERLDFGTSNQDNHKCTAADIAATMLPNISALQENTVVDISVRVLVSVQTNEEDMDRDRQENRQLNTQHFGNMESDKNVLCQSRTISTNVLSGRIAFAAVLVAACGDRSETVFAWTTSEGFRAAKSYVLLKRITMLEIKKISNF